MEIIQQNVWANLWWFLQKPPFRPVLCKYVVKHVINHLIPFAIGAPFGHSSGVPSGSAEEVCFTPCCRPVHQLKKAKHRATSPDAKSAGTEAGAKRSEQHAAFSKSATGSLNPLLCHHFPYQSTHLEDR